jgi:phosphoserine phosphatase RsbU/P
MNAIREAFLREQLLDRRKRIEAALNEYSEAKEIAHLLREIDAALDRMKNGSFGICETCKDAIEEDRLMSNPLIRYCLDHLTPDQRTALENDLALASRIQRSLLPNNHIVSDSWELYHYYEPVGPVSGDYCDFFHTGNSGEVYFIIGDVSGKGVSASILMSHLHAMFRSLIATGLPLENIITQANRIFTESTLSSQFATLVIGKTSADGSLELCNAGHCPPLLIQSVRIAEIAATGIPLGIFDSANYDVERLQLYPNDLMLLYTDGFSETRNSELEEYGNARISSLIGSSINESPEQLVNAFLKDIRKFRGASPQTDDMTLMVLRRITS